MVEPQTFVERRRIEHLQKELHWYAIHVTAQHERKVAVGLQALGFETYVPVRRELHRWSDRKKWVDVVLAPNLVFVRLAMCNKMQVYTSRAVQYFICAPGQHQPSIIHDEQMSEFIRMTQTAEKVDLTQQPLQKGDRVRVLEGPLIGCEGELLRLDGETRLVVRLGDMFAATTMISPEQVELVARANE